MLDADHNQIASLDAQLPHFYHFKQPTPKLFITLGIVASPNRDTHYRSASAAFPD